MTIKGPIKLYRMTIGNAMNSDNKFMDHLTVSQSGKEVELIDYRYFNDSTAEGNDYIIAFVPIHSRAGTNIQAAMQQIKRKDNVILVVLHHTFDENYLPPDSRRLFSEDERVFVVDCLFHEDKSLLNCLRNEEAIKAIKDHLGLSSSQSSFLQTGSSPSIRSRPQSKERSPLSSSAAPKIKWNICGVVLVYVLLFGFYIHKKTVSSKIHSIVIGSINKSDRMFIENLKALVYIEEVAQVDKCDVIMAFVPITSQAEKDIEDALQKIPATKPAVLVEMHLTHNSQFVPKDSKQNVKNKNVFVVDVLFDENQGLLKCKQNDEALTKVANYLKRNLVEALIIYGVVFLILTVMFNFHIKSVSSKVYCMFLGDIKESNLTFMKRLKSNLILKEMTSGTDCDVIMAFVPIRSRAGTDIQNALTNVPSSQPVVLVVMHHTFDPEYLPPDSRLNVNRTDVFAVDCLFHEGEGFLRSSRNDRAVEAVIKHLNEERNFTSRTAFLLKVLMLCLLLVSILLFVLDLGSDVFAALFLLILLVLVGWYLYRCQNFKRRLE